MGCSTNEYIEAVHKDDPSDLRSILDQQLLAAHVVQTDMLLVEYLPRGAKNESVRDRFLWTRRSLPTALPKSSLLSSRIGIGTVIWSTHGASRVVDSIMKGGDIFVTSAYNWSYGMDDRLYYHRLYDGQRIRFMVNPIELIASEIEPASVGKDNSVDHSYMMSPNGNEVAFIVQENNIYVYDVSSLHRQPILHDEIRVYPIRFWHLKTGSRGRWDWCGTYWIQSFEKNIIIYNSRNGDSLYTITDLVYQLGVPTTFGDDTYLFTVGASPSNNATNNSENKSYILAAWHITSSSFDQPITPLVPIARWNKGKNIASVVLAWLSPGIFATASTATNDQYITIHTTSASISNDGHDVILPTLERESPTCIRSMKLDFWVSTVHSLPLSSELITLLCHSLGHVLFEYHLPIDLVAIIVGYSLY
jgi:hypothetical protein